jgi:SHS2 domain-containing protein
VSGEVVARGGTVREAFVEAALALFSRAIDPAGVEPCDVREIRAHGNNAEALLAQWIDECCYLYEIEGFACRAVDLAVFDADGKAGGEPMRLHAFLHGEQLDPARHHASEMLVPSIAMRATAEGLEIRLTFPD